jgi:hypothetical protein
MSDSQPAYITVTRQDVTRNQLETAIWLWFHEADAVSIYTLVHAALTVLKDVGSKKGFSSHVYNKQMQKTFGDRLKMAPNFFKHANADPNKALRFCPELTELWTFDAANLFGKIYESWTPLMRTFGARFLLSHEVAGRVSRVELIEFLPKGILIEQINKLGRTEFFEKVYPVFREEGPATVGP